MGILWIYVGRIWDMFGLVGQGPWIYLGYIWDKNAQHTLLEWVYTFITLVKLLACWRCSNYSLNSIKLSEATGFLEPRTVQLNILFVKLNFYQTKMSNCRQTSKNHQGTIKQTKQTSTAVKDQTIPETGPLLANPWNWITLSEQMCGNRRSLCCPKIRALEFPSGSFGTFRDPADLPESRWNGLGPGKSGPRLHAGQGSGLSRRTWVHKQTPSS